MHSFNYSAKLIGLVCGLVLFSSCNKSQETHENTLKDAFEDLFYIGVAVNNRQVMGEKPEAIALVKTHFNSIVAENVMKRAYLQPEEGVFYFDEADSFVALGEKLNMHIVGHTLIWHSQAPEWFFVDENGKDVAPEVLKERMRTHIHTVVGRYKGRVHGWDVVNEAVEDNGELRNSKFLQILGEDYLRLAFEFTREADPDAALYYNDYNMAVPEKRETVVRMIKKLQSQGVVVDGIGMQGHNTLHWPNMEEKEKSIQAFAELGAYLMITELDISVLPWPGMDISADVSESFEFQSQYNPYPDGLSEETEARFNQRYIDYFDLLLKYHKNIHRVTFWGVADHYSWRNNWPVRGRTDYPLLFDRNYQAKPVVDELIKRASEVKAGEKITD